MKHNYHSHTVRCGHAVGTEREYIETGIKNGLLTIGFSDHSPYRFSRDRSVGVSVNTEMAEDYFMTLGLLREEYRKSHPEIYIPIGFELEYYPGFFEQSLEEIQNCAALLPSGERVGIDYIILGQHMIGLDTDTPGYTGMPDDSEKRLANYVSSVIAGMETGRFTYLAHPDLINFTGPEEIYEKHMRDICIAAKEFQVPLEINLLGLHEHRNYPNDLFFHMVRETGNLVCMGCDAHAPERVGNPELIAEGEAYAEKFGLTLLDKMELINPLA
ncbi:MAG: histidinol-phosphatase [Lachnospiraceae bacterium]|nr:histidinol-phosphatase [Lachnospiraceae bacterium]